MYLIFENEQPWVRWCTLKVAQRMNPELVEPSGPHSKIRLTGAYFDTNPVPRASRNDLVFSRRLKPPHAHLNKRMPGKKSKKPFKFFTTHSLAIPANIAVGPLGFRAVVDVNPEGERNHPYHELG